MISEKYGEVTEYYYDETVYANVRRAVDKQVPRLFTVLLYTFGAFLLFSLFTLKGPTVESSARLPEESRKKIRTEDLVLKAGRETRWDEVGSTTVLQLARAERTQSLDLFFDQKAVHLECPSFEAGRKTSTLWLMTLILTFSCCTFTS